jgi:hypothetical protein
MHDKLSLESSPHSTKTIAAPALPMSWVTMYRRARRTLRSCWRAGYAQGSTSFTTETTPWQPKCCWSLGRARVSASYGGGGMAGAAAGQMLEGLTEMIKLADAGAPPAFSTRAPVVVYDSPSTCSRREKGRKRRRSGDDCSLIYNFDRCLDSGQNLQS